MLKVVFPGTFDPPTNGHMNVIERAAKIFDKVEVVIAVNDAKKCLFTAQERYEMISELIKPLVNVSVHIWDKLIVEFAKRVDAKVILRGVRALTDFGYEFELAMMNKSLNKDIEIIFMPTDPKYFVLRSSVIKDIASLDGKISYMVPPVVEKALESKFKGA